MTEDARTLVCEKHVHDESCYTTERGDLTCEQDVHEHGDECYEAAEPVLTCEETEHTHGEDCYDEEGNLTCEQAEHTHEDACYTQGEDVLVCGKTAHTHGDDCYAVVTVKVCEEEDHEHGDDCYEVVEGEWSCTNVVGNFLAAVAGIPEITTENVQEAAEYVYGPVSDAYGAVLGTEYEERDDVLEAVAVYAAAIRAIDVELDILGRAFSEHESLFAKKYTIYDQNFVYEFDCKTVRMNNHFDVGETWEDEGYFYVWDKRYGTYVVAEWGDFDIWSTNPDVLEVSAQTFSDGKLKITYTAKADGNANIKLAFNARTRGTGDSLYNTPDMSGAAAAANCTIVGIGVGTGTGNSGNTGGGESGNKPSTENKYHYVNLPVGATMGFLGLSQYGLTPENVVNYTSDSNVAVISGYSIDDGEVYPEITGVGPGDTEVYCTYSNSNDTKKMVEKFIVHVYEPETVTISEETGFEFEYPGATPNSTPYAGDDDIVGVQWGYYSYSLAGIIVTPKDAGTTRVSGWHYSTKEVSNGRTSYDSFTISCDEWIVVVEDDSTTYTVTYTDGVTGKNVFPDQSYTNLKAGDATPAFVGTPTRENYTFMGWKLSVNGREVVLTDEQVRAKKVLAAEANADGEIIYTAVWEKKPTVAKTASDKTPAVGEEFHYTITVSNPTSKAIIVTITDKLNGKLDFVSASDGGTNNRGTVTWTDVTVPANGSKSVTVYVKANAAGTIDNTATVTWPGGSNDSNKETVTAPGITKEVMTKAEAAAAGLSTDGISFPNYKDGPLTFYNNAVEGTLLYKITVAGEAGAAYTVTDEGAVWVQGGESNKTENGVLTVTGTIPGGGEAVIYVTKLFTQSDIKFNSDKSCYVENTATVTPGVDGASSTDATAKTELNPFTVNGLKITKAFVGLTEAQIPGDFQMTYTVAANNDPSVVYAAGTLKLTGGSITPTVTKDEAAKTITYTWAIPQYTRPTSLQTDLTLTETGYAVENYTCTSTWTVYTTPDVTNGTVTYSLGMNASNPSRGIINTYASNTPNTPDAPDKDDLDAMYLGVQIVCDVANSGHAATGYEFNAAGFTAGAVTANTGANKDEYPYTCTVSITVDQQNNYWLGQNMQDGATKWNKDHKLLDNAATLTKTLYWDGESWTDLDTSGKWHYMVIHTTHKPVTPVTPEPDKEGLILVKKINGEDKVDLTVATRGDELTYTITVTNATNVNLADMLIRDRMPAGVTLVENSGSATVDDEARNVTVTESGVYHDWKVEGTVDDEAVVVLTYKAIVTADGEVNAVNAAKAFAKQAVKDTAKAANFKMARGFVSGGSGPVGPGNTGDGGTDVTLGGIETPDGYDGEFESNEDNATVTAPELSSALKITKSVSGKTEVQPGQEVDFRITVQNTSDQNMTNVKVTDVLPEGLTFVRAYNPMSAENPRPAITLVDNSYIFSTVAAGSYGWLAIVARVNDGVAPGTTITNTATAKGDGTRTVEDSAAITVVEKDATLDDLTITKTANTGSYKVGDQIEYNIKITNAAGQPAVVRVVDILPEGLEYVNSPCGNEYLDNAGNHRWNVRVPAAVNGTPGEFTVTVYARATKAGTLTNTATVQLTNNTAPFGDTKQDTESVEVAPTFEFPDANHEGVYVRVNCSTNRTHNSDPYWKTLNARNADGTLVYSGNEYYTIGEVTKNAEGKYQCVVTINPETWANMRLAELTDSPAHVYDPEKTESNNRTTLTYVYNAEKGYWRVSGSTVTVAFIKHVEHTVTVRYMCDVNGNSFTDTVVHSYTLAEGESYNHSVDPNVTTYPSPTGFNSTVKSPLNFKTSPSSVNTWVYDEVLTTDALTGTMGDHDIVIEVWYSKDNKGTNANDPTKDTSDGTPDKYQAKVVYTAGAGGTQNGVNTYATIMNNGKMATTGIIAITGATAAPNEGHHFVKWTAGATGHDGWSYTPSTDAALAGFDIGNAKGGAVYTFTANFEANPGTPLEVEAPDVTDTYDGKGHPVAPTTNKDGATVTVTYTYVDENGNTVTLPAGTEPTDAGEYTAEITATLDGETATATAKVTILKKALTVTTDSASKVHDGNPLTAPGRIDGLVNGETVTFTVTGSQTEVGSSSNTYTLTWDGTAKEGNYTVTEGTIGTLTVTNAPVIVIPDPVDTTYTLSYDANGGEGAPASQSQLNSNVFTVSGNEPTREGYTFQGWATTPDGAAVYQPGSSITITGLSQTLYAVWQQDEEDITDENPPLTDLPDTGDDKPDVDLPKDPTEDLPDEEEISDGDVPLTDVPKTGDHTNRFLVMAAVSGLCLLTLLSGRRKEDEA